MYLININYDSAIPSFSWNQGCYHCSFTSSCSNGILQIDDQVCFVLTQHIRKLHLMLGYLLVCYRKELCIGNLFSPKSYVYTSSISTKSLGYNYGYRWINLSITRTWKRLEFFLQSHFVYYVNSCVLCCKKHRRGFYKDAMPTVPNCSQVSCSLYVSMLPRAFAVFSTSLSLSVFPYINFKAEYLFGPAVDLCFYVTVFCCLFCFQQSLIIGLYSACLFVDLELDAQAGPTHCSWENASSLGRSLCVEQLPTLGTGSEAGGSDGLRLHTSS